VRLTSAEHAAPGAATLQVLQGRVRLVTSEASWELGPGDHLQLSPTWHRLESLEGAAVLLTVAATKTQLRETSGNLSGSGSETHQHLSPADANCC
jgi:quercetin dioxygenase-like cupin family protein